MKVTVRDKEVNIKTIKICGKCTDRCDVKLLDGKKVIVESEESYVPDFMPGGHGGDYILLDIDIDTGQILNWKPKRADVEEFINRHTEEDE